MNTYLWKYIGARFVYILTFLFCFCSTAFALATPPDKGAVVYIPNTILANVINNSVYQVVMMFGLAAGDSPLCVASNQSGPAPCQIIFSIQALLNAQTEKGACAGTMNPLKPGPNGPIAAGNYFEVSALDFSHLFPTGPGNFTGTGTFSGTVSIPGIGTIKQTKIIYLPEPCPGSGSPTGFCYADGSKIQPNELVAGGPMLKVVVSFPGY